jgi:hypothetical protein
MADDPLAALKDAAAAMPSPQTTATPDAQTPPPAAIPESNAQADPLASLRTAAFNLHSSMPDATDDTKSDTTTPSVSAPVAMGEGLIDALTAGAQHTSPIVRTAEGQPNYQPAADEAQWIFNETGNVQDEQTQVALRDPATGQYRVYQRNPAMEEGALTSLGRVAAYGTPEAGIPTVASAAEATAPQALLQDFERSGVAPSMPAVGQGIGSRLAANIVSKVPVFGQPIVAGAKQAGEQTGAAAERIAGGLGTAENAEDAGNVVQAGVKQFAKGAAPAGMSADDIIASPTRASSFAAKSGALYDRFWSMMDPKTPIPIDNTLDALKGPMERFPSSPELGAQITNPRLQSFYQTLTNSGGSLTAPELKEFRSYIGRAIGDPQLVDNIPRADLKQVYAGMSQDLEGAAKAQSPQAARAFEAANSYYSAGQSRIDQLEPLLSGPPEKTFATINRAAATGPSANAGVLRTIQRSLAPDDWNNVGAAVLRKMGAPTAGAKDVLHGSDFSPSSFVTNWSKLSDSAKDTLFGAQGSPVRDNIEALTRVAGAQKNVSKFANPSGTAAHVIGIAAPAVALGEHWETIVAHPVMSALAALGGYGASKMLMSPAAARWLYAMPSTISRAPNAAAGIERSLGGLDVLARSDPSLAPLAAQLRQNWTAAPTQPSEQAATVPEPPITHAEGGGIEGTPAESEDAIQRGTLAIEAKTGFAEGGRADDAVRGMSIKMQGKHLADLAMKIRQQHFADGGGVAGDDEPDQDGTEDDPRGLPIADQGAHLADMAEKYRKEMSARDEAAVPAD